MRPVVPLVLLISLFSGLSLSAQIDSGHYQLFIQEYDSAIALCDASKYGRGIEWLERSIRTADSLGMEEQRVNAIITKAEMLRRTKDWTQGIELLYQLKESVRFPRRHVRKLGRLAALYNESEEVPDSVRRDSVLHYLDSALTIAEGNNFDREKASLYNELGYTIYGDDRARGQTYFLAAQRAYWQMGDTQNYIGVSTNLMRCCLPYNDPDSVERLFNHLNQLVENKSWYSAKIELYGFMNRYYREARSDSSRGWWWKLKRLEAENSLAHELSGTKLTNIRSRYEQEKLKTGTAESERLADQRTRELEQQNRKTRELIVYLSLMGLLVAGIGVLVVRQRRLRLRTRVANAALQESNDKYHMLVVESNHRIKNNLQMVISMLQYSRDDGHGSNSNVLENVSGKIHTVSALHKFLSKEAHNELMAMDTYFQELIANFRGQFPEEILIRDSITNVAIRSERMVYFGLVLNELLTAALNSLPVNKRGDSGQQGNIVVEVVPHDEAFLFRFRSGWNMQENALVPQLIHRVGGKSFAADPDLHQIQFSFSA